MSEIEYKITDIDYWEQDAILVIDGKWKFYFQFSDTTKPPSIDDALEYLTYAFI